MINIEKFPFPGIKECLLECQNSKIFSALDLNLGHHQLELSEEALKYTSFYMLGQQYEFKRMPFCLANALCSFQRIMKETLNGLDYFVVYLDGILIHLQTR